MTVSGNAVPAKARAVIWRIADANPTGGGGSIRVGGINPPPAGTGVLVVTAAPQNSFFISALDATGKLYVNNSSPSGSVDIIIDVAGYYGNNILDSIDNVCILFAMKKGKLEFPNTLQEAIKYFANDDRGLAFMIRVRWPDEIVKCPSCGSEDVSFIASRRVWNCRHCTTKKQFSIKVGTVMEDSPISLDKWLAGFWLIANAKNGISSYELHRSLGITQKTAWFMLHRIRLAMQNGSIEKMKGRVEADETYIGARARNMHKNRRTGVGHAGIKKAAVQGILERGKGKKHSRVVLKVLNTTRRPELCGNVREYVLGGSTVCTDSLMSYDDLERDYDRQVVDHLETYAKGHVHTNGLENFWSLFKRSLKGTYVSVEPFHLFRYCDEQAFRFNERKDTDQGRFIKAVSGIVGKGLRYAKLIGQEDGGSLPPQTAGTWQTT